MSHVPNIDLENKPAELLFADVLAELPTWMRFMRNETLKWKTFIENNPDDISGINRQGDALCKAIDKDNFNKVITALGRSTKEFQHIQVFFVEWESYVKACNNKNERTNTNKQIFAKITKLEQEAPSLQVPYVNKLKLSWRTAVLRTLDCFQTLWNQSTMLAKGRFVKNKYIPLKKGEIKLCRQIIEEKFEIIFDMNKILNCFNNETARWFVKRQWPLVLEAYNNSKWEDLMFVTTSQKFPLEDLAETTLLPVSKWPKFRPHSDFKERRNPYGNLRS